jgi:hypothetical protein
LVFIFFSINIIKDVIFFVNYLIHLNLNISHDILKYNICILSVVCIKFLSIIYNLINIKKKHYHEILLFQFFYIFSVNSVKQYHHVYSFVYNIENMAIKSNKSPILFYTFCIFFIFILIYGTIVLNNGNDYQLAFSQGYIPPPSNNFKPQSIQCPQIVFSGPTYKGLGGCPTPCPTTNNNPNVANVYIPPECQNQVIGNQLEA